MSACVLWTGSRRGKRQQYGQVYCPIRKRQVGAHVKAWESANGRMVPAGHCVMHSCDTPLCVNEDHLVLGTIADNNEDMRDKGRAFPPPRNPRDPVTGRWTS